MTQPRIKPLSNPYKLQPAKPKEKRSRRVVVEKAPADLKAGDYATCSYKPLLFSIPNPAFVLEVVDNDHYSGGYAVLVNTSIGFKYLAIRYFTRIPAGE